MRYFIAMMMMLISVSVISQSTCPYKLKGHVIDEDLGKELDNATVKVVEANMTVSTDKHGDFVFSNLCPGTYTIVVTHVDCEDYKKSFIITNKDLHIDVRMPHAKNTLGEAVVSATIQHQNTGINKALGNKELKATRGESLGEVLSKLSGVTIMQTGSTIAKPVVHGLFGSRLLTVANGVRQEGQQWGNEHAPEVDPFIANSITIIKGVDQLKYGSDAIAGVVILDPKPLGSAAGKTLDLNTGFFSNNLMYYANAVYEQSPVKYPSWAYRVHGTYKRGANTATPLYRLNNTGIKEASYSLTIANRGVNRQTEFFVSGFHTTLGIFKGSHIGNTTDLKNAIAASKSNDVFLNEQTYKIERPRQEVCHYLGKIKSAWNLGNQRLTAQIAYQNNLRKEYDILINRQITTPQLNLNIHTISEDISWDYKSDKQLQSIIGLSGVQQVNNYNGRYFIPHYFSNSIGAFVIEKLKLQHWELQAGLRADIKKIETTRLKFNNDTVNHTFKFNTVAGSINALYHINTHLKSNISFSLSTRAPYVNELLSDGIHHGTATYEKGNLSLKPEQSIFTAWNLKYMSHNQKFEFDILLHRNQIKNFIYQQPRPNDPMLTIGGAFPKIEWQQENALLYGVDASTSLYIVKHLHYISKISVLYAKNKSTNNWLPLMPADRWTNELSWSFNDGRVLRNSFTGIEVQAVAKQKRLPEPYELYDFKTPPNGYVLLQFNAGTTLKIKNKPVDILIQVKNITNTVYRDYQNSFRYFSDEPGRNFALKLKIPIL